MNRPRLVVLFLLLLCLCSVGCDPGEEAGGAGFVELEDQIWTLLEDQIRTMQETVDTVREEARVVRQAAQQARAAWEANLGNGQQSLPAVIEQSLERTALAEAATITAKARVMAAEITAGWVGELWLSPSRPHITSSTSLDYLDRIHARLLQSQFAADKALQHTETAVAEAQAVLAQAQTALAANTP